MGGLGKMFHDATKALGTVAKGVEMAVENPGAAAKGVGMVADYAIKHPGQMGKMLVKSMTEEVTNPVNLAINAALLIGTAGTANLAKTGAKVAADVGTKAVAEAGIKAGAEAGTKAVGEAATKAAAEAGIKATAEAGTKSVAEAGTKVAGRAESFVDAALRPRMLEKATNPLEMSKWGSGALRTKVAEKIAPVGAGPLRQGLGAVAQGLGRAAPTQLPGMGDTAFKVQKAAWAIHRVEQKREGIETAGKVVDAAAHPMQTAMKVGSKTSDPSSGQTQVSQPSTALQPLSQPVNSYSPGRGFNGGGGGQPPTMGGTSSGAYGGMPGSPLTPPSSGGSPQRSMSATDSARSWLGRPRIGSDKPAHFWHGPNREVFRGIEPGYDWRKGFEVRPEQKGAYRLPRGTGGEEAEQPGAYDVKSGQQPMGALNPGAPKMTALGQSTMPQLGPGPRVHFGEPGARPMGPADGGRKASFYAGSGVIDADSSSPDDYKFEPGGQGFLDFPDIAAKPLVQPKRGRAVLGV